MVLEKIFGAFSGGTAFELTMVIVLTILIAYVIGVMISHIVDRKLGDIAIQMPKININAPTPSVQPPQIVFRISEDAEGKINLQPLNELNASNGSNQSNGSNTSNVSYTSNPSNPSNPSNQSNYKKRNIRNIAKDSVYNHPNKINTTEPFLAVTFDETIRDDVSAQSKSPPSRIQQDPYKEYNTPFVMDTLDYPIVVDTQPPPTEVKSKIGCSTDADCNVVNGNGNNVCKSDGTCHCLSGSGLFCQYGPTNYKDPKDMTIDELNRFKMKYRSNMTLQDYKNWLMLYKDEVENIRQHHRRNLLKLLKGGQLTEKDVPAIRIKPPTDAADYFQKMYHGGKISVHFPDNDSPLVGANYTNYTDFVPPENTGSSWITGVVDLYKEAGKDDAKALDWYIRPDTTTGVEEEGVGATYQKYLSKQHDYSDLRKIAKVINESEKDQVRQNLRINLNTFGSKDLNLGDINL
jgi:hypothetical protein